jgi:DNA-directed RNA polymerase-3 subunit RPC5
LSLTQIINCTFTGNVLRYSRLVEVLKTRLNVSIDEISVLRSTQAVAVLVQGCWVVKSELLYPTDFVSDVSGISGDLMQKGRDYIVSP